MLNPLPDHLEELWDSIIRELIKVLKKCFQNIIISMPRSTGTFLKTKRSPASYKMSITNNKVTGESGECL